MLAYILNSSFLIIIMHSLTTAAQDTYLSTTGEDEDHYLPRRGYSVALSNGTIILMGDYIDDATALNDVWKSVDDGETWTEVNEAEEWAVEADISISICDGDTEVFSETTESD